MNEHRPGSQSAWRLPEAFLKELPDLLCGSDPELLKPAAREWMRSDPKAREFADRLLGAVALLADVPTRIARASNEAPSLRARRGVRAAIDRLPQRLAEVAWALLTIEIDELAKENGGALIVPTRDDLSFLTESKRLRWECDRILALAKEQGVAPSSARVRKIIAAGDRNRIESWIEIFGICLPKHSMIRWSRLLLDHFSGQRSLGIEWRSFIRDAEVTAYYDHVLQTGALACESAGDRVGALDLCSRFFERFPTSSAAVGAAYTGLKVSALIREPASVHRYLERFGRALSIAPNQSECWRQQFLIDAAEWRIVSVSSPWLIRELFDVLGSQS